MPNYHKDSVPQVTGTQGKNCMRKRKGHYDKYL